MTIRDSVRQLTQLETLNFALTNRIPRVALTRFMGWFSKIENPLVRRLSIALWQQFTDLDLNEARKTAFSSMHDCFVRELKPGARPLDERAQILVSPCDGVIGASGTISGDDVLQAKDSHYPLHALLQSRALADEYRGGSYVTLRIRSSMYHRFHAPQAGRVRRVTYVDGDTWNVNPPALKRVPMLFCKNERAVVEFELSGGGRKLTLVPVAAILVASIRLHCLDLTLHPRWRGAQAFDCDQVYSKGEEMGWFQHGSTIIVLAPQGVVLCEHLREGAEIRMGQALFTCQENSEGGRPNRTQFDAATGHCNQSR